MTMFFEPHTFLEGDPAEARTAREAARLEREAGQRARLCGELVEVAARRGFEATAAHEVFRLAKVGSGTFQKLYGSKDACMLDAFEACAKVILARVEESVAGEAEPRARLEAGLRTLLDLLSAEPARARVALVEARAADAGCREAQLRFADRIAGLFAGGGEEAWLERMGPRAVIAIIAIEVAAGRTAVLPLMLPELTLVGMALMPRAVTVGKGARRSTTAQ
jgi:AcrR family transcriptional regulator